MICQYFLNKFFKIFDIHINYINILHNKINFIHKIKIHKKVWKHHRPSRLLTKLQPFLWVIHSILYIFKKLFYMPSIGCSVMYGH